MKPNGSEDEESCPDSSEGSSGSGNGNADSTSSGDADSASLSGATAGAPPETGKAAARNSPILSQVASRTTSVSATGKPLAADAQVLTRESLPGTPAEESPVPTSTAAKYPKKSGDSSNLADMPQKAPAPPTDRKEVASSSLKSSSGSGSRSGSGSEDGRTTADSARSHSEGSNVSHQDSGASPQDSNSLSDDSSSNQEQNNGKQSHMGHGSSSQGSSTTHSDDADSRE